MSVIVPRAATLRTCYKLTQKLTGLKIKEKKTFFFKQMSFFFGCRRNLRESRQMKLIFEMLSHHPYWGITICGDQVRKVPLENYFGLCVGKLELG